MSVPGENEARALLDKVMKASRADQCSATLTASSGGNIRYALNSVSTSAEVGDAELTIEVAFGKRVGTTTINQFDDTSIEAAVRRAEELARLAPENPEFVPAIEKQAYKPSNTYGPAAAAVTPQYRAQVAADCIEPCRRSGLVAAGFFTDRQSVSAIANSKGNFGYQKSAAIDFTCTVRTEDGRGSGWVARNLADVSKFDAKAEIGIAMRKAKDSVGAKALEPGKYTVILEPQALAPLMLWLSGGFDAREADEGRSFLAKKGGGNRIGDTVFGDAISLHADPWDPEIPIVPWDAEGVALQRVPLIGRGKVEALSYSRYWAQQQRKPATGALGNLIMAGSDKSTLDLVRATRKGVLVTRTHYVNIVDPQTMLLTGLTRDGTFYIENGEIKYPIKNFRFEESVVVMLNNVEEIGRPQRLVTFEDATFPMKLPPIKVRDFTFASLSDAI